MSKPVYTKPGSQLDLEARQKSDYVPPSVKVEGTDDGPSKDGFIGVDDVYRNYANENEAVVKADKGVEQKLRDEFLDDDVDFSAGATPEGVDEAQEKLESERETGTAGSTSGSSSTTPSTPTPPATPGS